MQIEDFYHEILLWGPRITFRWFVLGVFFNYYRYPCTFFLSADGTESRILKQIPSQLIRNWLGIDWELIGNWLGFDRDLIGIWLGFYWIWLGFGWYLEGPCSLCFSLGLRFTIAFCWWYLGNLCSHCFSLDYGLPSPFVDQLKSIKIN